MQQHPQSSNSPDIQDTKPVAKPRPLLLKPAVFRPVLLFAALMLALGYHALEMFGGGSPAIASENPEANPAVIELFTSQGLRTGLCANHACRIQESPNSRRGILVR